MTPKELYEWAAEMGVGDSQIKVTNYGNYGYTEHELTDGEVATDGTQLILEMRL